MDKSLEGKVLTARGPVAPEVLGAVLMHEHLHSDLRTWEEKPIAPERMELLMGYGVPNLKRLHQFGCHAFCDCTMPPWRAWPDVYLKVSEAADIHIIVATGFYREMEVGTYMVKTEADAIWPWVREASVEDLAGMCIREFEEGIHGTTVRPGCLKLGTSSKDLTPTELKTFRAAARAHKATGLFITTHCTRPGAHVAQLEALEKEGVDPYRVVIGHTASHLVNENQTVRECMRRGATFLPTNLRMDGDWEFIAALVKAIRQLFEDGLGDRLVLGLDWAFETEQGPFVPCTFMPPPPYVYMFGYVLPRFRKLGLEEQAIAQMLVKNPARILPVK
jgi:phosphotriesterase-related protein